MSLISDISSVSTYDSMPPLVDRHGRIIFEDDDGASTITDDAFELPPQNTHLYFDDNGDEISYEEYRNRLYEEQAQESHPQQEAWGGAEEPEEDEEPPWIRTPLVNQRFLLKHPRVILAFLRFIDLYNELADPEEVFMIRAIPQSVIATIRNHSSVTDVPPEFQAEVNELLYRLENHQDLSELNWSQPPP
jgi:hypothetical protein